MAANNAAVELLLYYGCSNDCTCTIFGVVIMIVQSEVEALEIWVTFSQDTFKGQTSIVLELDTPYYSGHSL